MQNNKPIWFNEDKTTFANEDTYQTIKHNKVDSNYPEINLDLEKCLIKLWSVLHVTVKYLCITLKQY
jgi:hypothetical protein